MTNNSKITIIKDDREGRNRPWQVRWAGEFNPLNGKQKRYCKCFFRKRQAEVFAEKLQNDFDSGMPRDEKNITLAELCIKFNKTQNQNHTKSTQQLYNECFSRLKNYFGDSISIKYIKQETAEEFIAQLDYIHPYFTGKAKKFSTSSRNRILRCSKRLFQKAFEWHYARTNAFSNIKQITTATNTDWHKFTVQEFNSILEKTKDIRVRGLLFPVNRSGTD